MVTIFARSSPFEDCKQAALSVTRCVCVGGRHVREKTSTAVNMRVGIHTGSVLAGVLGQKQWQYDIYSKDVELANKMESSGCPGKVHISDKTVRCLNDTFEVTPALAENAEPVLRRAGLKTFFVSHKCSEADSNCKIDILSTEDNRNIHAKSGSLSTPTLEKSPDAELRSPTTPGTGKFEAEISRQISVRTSQRESEISSEITLSRQQFRDLLPYVRCLTLSFLSDDLEKDFRQRRMLTSGIIVVCLPALMLGSILFQSLVLNVNGFTFINYIICSIILFCFSCFLTPGFIVKRFFPSFARRFTNIYENNLCQKFIIVALNILLMLNILLDLLSFRLSHHSSTVSLSSPPSSVTETDFSQVVYTPDFIYVLTLFLMAYPLFIEIGHITKLCLCVTVSVLYMVINCVVIPEQDILLGDNNRRFFNRELLATLLIVVEVFVVTLLLNLHTEISLRVAYMWKREMIQKNLDAVNMRQKNEQLIQNILPSHVTKYYLRSHADKSRHHQLYAQSFEQVGVVFASMPNFSDFYTEETINNQGLECLRFLNEVISDYDALLDREDFKCVCKIKTIASTYMAASGLNNIQERQQNCTEWNHFAILVHFAFEMIETLNIINEQSFNHFVLKIGINLGPVTAGVIGASKPHFDIWGNTVNVASRMESTGQAGKIQCTQECADYLANLGFCHQKRGIISIKGKGDLLTFFITSRPQLSSVRVNALERLDDSGDAGTHRCNVSLCESQPLLLSTQAQQL